MKRVQVVLSAEEREVFRRQAKLEGLSLSAWFRLAARHRLASAQKDARIRSPEELRAFFESCDHRESDQGPEPNWETHLKVIEESRKQGASST